MSFSVIKFGIDLSITRLKVLSCNRIFKIYGGEYCVYYWEKFMLIMINKNLTKRNNFSTLNTLRKQELHSSFKSGGFAAVVSPYINYVYFW